MPRPHAICGRGSLSGRVQPIPAMELPRQQHEPGIAEDSKLRVTTSNDREDLQESTGTPVSVKTSTSDATDDSVTISENGRVEGLLDVVQFASRTFYMIEGKGVIRNNDSCLSKVFLLMLSRHAPCTLEYSENLEMSGTSVRIANCRACATMMIQTVVSPWNVNSFVRSTFTDMDVCWDICICACVCMVNFLWMGGARS